MAASPFTENVCLFLTQSPFLQTWNQSKPGWRAFFCSSPWRAAHDVRGSHTVRGLPFFLTLQPYFQLGSWYQINDTICFLWRCFIFSSFIFLNEYCMSSLLKSLKTLLCKNFSCFLLIWINGCKQAIVFRFRKHTH